MGQAIGSRGFTLVRPAGSGTRAGLQSANRDLAVCLGFQADDPNGRVGTVVGIVFGSQADRPERIAIRVGLFHRTVIAVPVEAVATVDVSRKRVTLNSTPHGRDLSRRGPQRSAYGLAVKEATGANQSRGGDDVNLPATGDHS